mmetsp:Transcript_54147/g.136797  ORF Transcript_54147/g.136797 Transcript_54147/m.136797 type:complete len:743 (-) Transcript_54147:189-2417(-)
MALQRLWQHFCALVPCLLFSVLVRNLVVARDPTPACSALDGNESCAAVLGHDAADMVGLLQRRVQDSREALRPAIDSTAAAAGGAAEIVLDMLVMADIGHPREYSNGSYLTGPFPMGYGKVEGSFSLYDGIGNYITQQGARPKHVLIAGDVSYGGGTKKVLDALTASFRKCSDGSLPDSVIFPGIGNHDVSYLGCTSTPQLLNLEHPKTCFYGGETVGIFASSHQMSYTSWVDNWMQAFTGLSGSKVILPPRTTTGTCKTTGGNAGGAECKFPFTHLLEEYNGCITSIGYSEPWCYTGGSDWGYCSTTCTPEISSWTAPTRYNLDLNPSSSVYIIVGLIAGAEITYWNGDTPPESVPVGGPSGAQAECKFLSDSLNHGKSLGKTVFIYATHWFQEGCTDWSLIQQIDIWLYGHDHNMWQAPLAMGTVVQEQRYFPAAMLLGNGGYDDGQYKYVSFVHLTEEIVEGRSKVNLKVFDTCKSITKCPSTDNPNFAQCWHECQDYPDGYNNRKAVPNTNFGFTYDAPQSAQGASEHSLNFPAKLRLKTKWVALGECASHAMSVRVDRYGSYRSTGASSLVDPHASILGDRVANLSLAVSSSSSNTSSNTSSNIGSNNTGSSGNSPTPECLVPVEDESKAVVFYFYDVNDTSARLTVDTFSRAPVVQDGKVLLQRYGFYDLYLNQPTEPHTRPSGMGRCRPQDGYLMSFASALAEGKNMVLGIDFVDGVLQVLEDGNTKIDADIVRA